MLPCRKRGYKTDFHNTAQHMPSTVKREKQENPETLNSVAALTNQKFWKELLTTMCNFIEIFQYTSRVSLI
jgi:hypothetical protein